MKKVLAILLILLAQTSIAQTSWVKFDLGYGAYELSNTISTGIFDRVSSEEASSTFLSLAYGKRYSKGFSFGFIGQGNLFNNTVDSTGTHKGRAGSIGLVGSVYLLTRPKYELYLNITTTATFLTTTHNNLGIESSVRYTGPNIRGALGLAIPLTDIWKLRFESGYTIYSYAAKKTFGPAPPVNLNFQDLQLDYLGFEFQLGLTYTLGQKERPQPSTPNRMN